MRTLPEIEESLLTIKYAPDKIKVNENPPRFTWVPTSEKDVPYKMQISREEDFPDGMTETLQSIPYNFCTLNHTLEPGTYYWRYSIDGEEEYTYSRVRSFSVGADLPETPLPGREERYSQAEMGHPRLWLNQSGLKQFQEEVKKNREYCGFQKFYEESVSNYIDKPFIAEPEPYPNHKRVVDIWRKNYTICQEAMYYVRCLSVAGRILEDEKLINQAKDCLLQLAAWDVHGTTSREYNDECSFRVVYGLAFGYDWLYEYLSESERETVRNSLFVRTEEVAKHVLVNSRIHFSLYDSHAVRSLSSVLTPCCMALLGERKEAKDWLDYTIEYFSVIYTPWGGMDGGWAEGPMYWTTGMAYVIDAMNLIKSYLGIDLYKRPFFQKTGDFPLYCNPVDTYRACFGDQSNIGKYPGHKTAFNMRQFGGAAANPWYQWYYEKVFEREPEIDPSFFNTGWWDFGFDEMVFAHDYGNINYEEKKSLSMVKWFHDIGWVAINKEPEDFENHIFFLTKSSPYGCVSHSHGDQNSFLLFAYEEPLVIISGYYIGFNTSMHRDWRRQTKSHNNILIRGVGQYADMDKAKQLRSKGQICCVEEKENYVYIRESALEAYKETVPDIVEAVREIYFVDQSYFVLVDSIETEGEADLDWRLHSLSPYEIQEDEFYVTREKARLKGRFIYCSSGIEEISQSDKFEGANEAEIEGMPRQYHLNMHTGIAKGHVIVTLLVPEKTGKEKSVTAIKDDQGHDIYHYFNHEGKTFSLRVDGNKRY